MKTKHVFSKAGLFLTALACLLPLTAARGQDSAMEPVLTISISSYQDVMEAAEAIAKKVEKPEAMTMPKMMLGAEGPKGVDQTQPIGAVLQTDGSAFVPLVFLPVNDVDAFLQNPWMQDQAELIGEPDAEGIYTLEMEQSFYMLPKNGWVFLTNQRAMFEQIPDDPLTLLGGLNEQYLLAIKGDLTPISPEMVNGLLMPLQAMVAMRNSDPAFQENFQQSMNQLKKVANEIKTMTMGIAIDPSTVDITFEALAVAKPNTDIAIQYTANAGMTTDRIGFYQPQESVMAGIVASSMMEFQASQLKNQFQEMFNGALQKLQTEDLNEQEMKLAEGILQDFHDVIDATIEQGEIDMAFSVLPSDILAAAKIAEGDKFAETMKELLEIAAEENPEMKERLEIDAETYKGYALTKWSAALSEIPDAQGIPAALRNRSVVVCLGTKSDGLCMVAGVGEDPIATLKKAIDDSQANAEADLPETVLRISFENVAEMIKLAGEDAGPIAQVFQEKGQGAEILGKSTFMENGAKSAMIVSGEVLGLIPPLVEMGVNAQQAADDAYFGFENDAEDIQEIEIEGDSGDLGEPMGGGSMMGGGMGMGATPEEDDVEAETP